MQKMVRSVQVLCHRVDVVQRGVQNVLHQYVIHILHNIKEHVC